MEGSRKRHCWECLRRRIVCDFTQPTCKKCLQAGVQCPGYGDKKPARLRWLSPGKVASRRQARDRNSGTGNGRHAIVVATGGVGHGIAPRSDMETEARALLEAVDYCDSPLPHSDKASLTWTDNTCIYRDLLPLHELGQHPAIYPVTPVHLQRGTSFPEYIRLSLICTTLSHRINRTKTNDTANNSLIKSFCHFRGIIIRSLRENIQARQNRDGDLLVSGVISLLLADVSPYIEHELPLLLKDSGYRLIKAH